MKKFKSLFNHIPLEKLAAAATLILFFITLIKFLINLILQIPFVKIISNLQILINFTLFSAFLFLWFSFRRFSRKFTLGFRDKFKVNLQDNWDYKGRWRIAEKGTLLITGNEPSEMDNLGGITKIGYNWENYSFSFKARIINQCLGVVVRARDLNNYYMFQIRANEIIPHRRDIVPSVSNTANIDNGQKQKIEYNVGWSYPIHSIPLNKQLNDWFSVNIMVRGQSVSIYINGELVLQRDFLLEIQTGRVGFRNCGSEEAHVKNLRVRILS